MSTPHIPFTLSPPTVIAEKGEKWSSLILPDLQYYSSFFPHHFDKILHWVKQHKNEFNIKNILTVGDNVDVNKPEQWKRVSLFYQELNQLNLPAAICMGNHDFQSRDKIKRLGRPSSKTSLAKEFINFEQMGQKLFAGKMPSSSRDDYNYYYTFQTGQTKWLILNLSWDPSDEILDWCNKLIQHNPNYRCILITHSYMESNYKRMSWDTSPIRKFGKIAALFQGKGSDSPRNKFFYSWPPGNTSNDGETIWEKLVKKNPFYFVLSGHVKGVGHRFDLTNKQTPCCQMSINYQSLREGGMGIFRIMTFLSDNKIQVQSFAPHTVEEISSTRFRRKAYGPIYFSKFTKESTLIKGPRQSFNIDFTSPQITKNQHIQKSY